MTRKYFGTDGIRGLANCFPMTSEMAMRVAMACAVVCNRGGHRHRVVIGKDTRLSGYMLEQSMSSGFVAMGMDVLLVGPIPTPAVAMLTRSLRADLGVMISASHNPYQDNGIKIFGPDGYKISDEQERRVEELIDGSLSEYLPDGSQLGQTTHLNDARGRYIERLKRGVSRDISLADMKVVVDCAHGAAYKVAPQLLWELEADVVSIGVQPDGRNINDECGATATQCLSETVLKEKADIGISLDGDADRLIVVDEQGKAVDGDQLMALLAVDWKNKGHLNENTLVSTVMSNLGLEKFLESEGISMMRTAVGDRHVVNYMRERDYTLGGEQSGHIILGGRATTGDGLMAALQVLSVLSTDNRPASEVLSLFTPYPQILRNVRFGGASPLDRPVVQDIIAQSKERLANDGRLLVRPSGTEPLIRVMAEGEDARKIDEIVTEICRVIEREAAE